MHRVSFASFVIVAVVATSSTVYAGSITFSSAGPGADDVELSASALFDVSGATLKTTLQNTGDMSGSGNDLSPMALIAGGNGWNPQTEGIHSHPLLETEVRFTMLIAGGSLLESQISNVSFQYGTSLSEPKLPAGMRAPASIPEPATLLLLAPAIALAVRRRRRAGRR